MIWLNQKKLMDTRMKNDQGQQMIQLLISGGKYLLKNLHGCTRLDSASVSKLQRSGQG